MPGLAGGAHVHVLAEAALPAATAALKGAGFLVHVVDGSGASGKDAFLHAAVTALGLPATCATGWDAFADGLRLALEERPGPHGIVWTGAHGLVGEDLQAFVDAVTVLDAVAAEAGMIDGERDPVQVEVLVAGSGPGFPR